MRKRDLNYELYGYRRSGLMSRLKQVRLDKDRFIVFKKILESRLNRKFSTDNGAINYFLDHYRDLLYPDFEKYYQIEIKVNASLKLSAHQAKHFINMQIRELNFLANCINILFIDYLNSEENVNKIIEKESGLRRLIAYEYDRKYNRREVK